MGKEKVISLAVLAMLIAYGAANAVPSGPFGYDLQADMHRSENKQNEDAKSQEDKVNPTQEPINLVPKTAKDFYSFVPRQDLYVDSIDHKKYYVNPSIKSAIYKYKTANYTGCLQELYAYIENPKNVNDAYAYYYMGLAYSKIGESTAAKNCFQKTINCDAKGRLLEMAVKGRDCISGGIYCTTPINNNPVDIKIEQVDELDAFINAPYSGYGFSPEAEKDYKQRQLNNLQKKINNQENLNREDIRNLKEIDSQKKK